MRKLFSLFVFGAGTAFGALFATKRGEEIRSELKKKQSGEERAEYISQQAQAMAHSFWNTVKGPLNKLAQSTKKELEVAGHIMGKQAQKKATELKTAAKKEIRREVKIARKKLQSTVVTAKKIMKKKVKSVIKKSKGR
ncbi:MAG: hypothetical protein Q8P95_04010 [bacterium]|nr:hypothetical protein [bacterium]